jgi:hypothetical protein
MSFCAAKGNGRVACANKQSTTLAQAQKEDQLISMSVPALNIASDLTWAGATRAACAPRSPLRTWF